MRRVRKLFGRIYWPLQARWHHSAAAKLYRRMSNPVWLARRCLTRTIVKQSNFARGRLLDIGCGNKPYRRFLTGVEQYVGVDLPWPGSCADVYGDGTRLPFVDSTFDTVLCNQVLEHVSEPHELLAEIARVLKPGGVLMLTTPQVWGLHMEPYDFFRYTRYGLRHLAESHGLAVVQIDPTSGIWATLAQRLVDALVQNYGAGRAAWLNNVMGLALSPVLLGGFLLERLFGMYGDTLDNVLIARKQTAAEASGADDIEPAMLRAA